MSLFIALALLFGRKADDARLQKETVLAIQALGGRVYYDYQKSRPDIPNVFNPRAASPVPIILRQLLGDDWFHSVVMVSLRDTDVVDDDLRKIEKLTDLENLDLTGTGITSAGMQHLSTLSRIKCLCLWRTSIDDEGIKCVRSMPELWSLILDETLVTDAGLENLKDLVNLEEWLGLSRLLVSDEGLKNLSGLTKLRSLTLRDTGVTAQGKAALQKQLPKTDICIDPIVEPNNQELNGVALRNELTTRLRQQIAAVDRICGLKSAQLRKLQLAGRGDLRRFLDRQKEMREELRVAAEGPKLPSAGPFGEGSLFCKTLETGMSSEQGAKFAPFRSLFQRGIQVQVWPGSARAVTAIRLSGAGVSDQDLDQFEKLEDLRLIALVRTGISEAGLRHLKPVKRLQDLWLVGTKITDAAVDELQRECPGLAVRRTRPTN